MEGEAAQTGEWPFVWAAQERARRQVPSISTTWGQTKHDKQKRELYLADADVPQAVLQVAPALVQRSCQEDV